MTERVRMRRDQGEEHQMAGDDRTLDEAEGRVEQAAGALTGDDDVQREGKVDRAVSEAKTSIDRIAEKVKGLLRSDH